MSNYTIGTVMVSKRDGSTAARQMIVDQRERLGRTEWRCAVTEAHGDGFGAKVGHQYWEHEPILDSYYDVVPQPNADGLFTTTITTTTTTTETLDFAEGDVIIAPEPSAGYWRVERVEQLADSDVYLTCYSGWLEAEGNGYSYNSFKVSIADEGYRLLHFGGAPLTVERAVNSDVVVEHRWQVGDVIKGKVDGVYEWLVTGVAVEGGDAVYNLTCQDGSGFTTTCRTADDDTWKLVGGLRFEAEQEAARVAEEARKVTALQTLRKARDLISVPEQWTKDTFKDHNGRLCALGAINVAAGSPDGSNSTVPHSSRGLAVDARTAIERVVGNNIWMWNDRPARTHDEVLAAFDKAIGDLAWAEARSE